MNTQRRGMLASLLGFTAMAVAPFGKASAVNAPTIPTFDVHEDFSGRITDWLCDYQIETGRMAPCVRLTRAAFKFATRNNLIDYTPTAYELTNAQRQVDTAGKSLSEVFIEASLIAHPSTPHLFGTPVDVPGTKLRAALAAGPIALAGPWSGLKTVTHSPPGIPTFDWTEDGFVGHVVDWLADSQCDGVDYDTVYFTRLAYQQAMRHNLIDFIPDSEGLTNVPVFLGRQVRVVLDRRT